MFPLNDTDFPRDLYVHGDEKVTTPRSEQNPYTHTDPKILNMDGRSDATTSCLPEMPTSDLPSFPHHATVPLPPIQPNHGERIPVLGFYTIRECDGQLIYCLTFASGSPCLPYSLESTIGAKSMPQHICTKQSSAKSSTSTTKKGSPFSGEEDALLQSLKDKGLPWQDIAKHFPGRTQGALQTRFCTKLKNDQPTARAAKRKRKSVPGSKDDAPFQVVVRVNRVVGEDTQAIDQRRYPPRRKRLVNRYGLRER